MGKAPGWFFRLVIRINCTYNVHEINKKTNEEIKYKSKSKSKRVNVPHPLQTHKQTDRRGKRKAILGPAVRALCALRLIKTAAWYRIFIAKRGISSVELLVLSALTTANNPVSQLC